MRRRGAVQRKVPCLFVTEVKEEPSAKRQRQVPGAARGGAQQHQHTEGEPPGPAGRRPLALRDQPEGCPARMGAPQLRSS